MNGKVLVTGGLGNLGSWITAKLANQGYDVYVLTRREKYQIPNIKYKVIECDITDKFNLKHKLDLINFDYCVHCASFNEYFLENYPQVALQINTLGTRNILEVLAQKNIKHFIYFSTFHVYGCLDGTITEETEPKPKNDYAATHLFGEYYVKQFFYNYGIPYTILRLTNSYGTPMYKNTDKWYLVLNNLVLNAFKNQKIILNTNGRAKRDFIWMSDICDVVSRLLDITPTNDIYNLSSGGGYEIIELANMVKFIYENRYYKKIDIMKNDNDKIVYENIFVENDKIKKLIQLQIHDKINDTISQTFDLLELKGV
ncbi:nucleoside-diphosphate-sugar epimerase [Campylobacter iguaniorum]|uniref:NAD-dependent epimerase/dehydratase family protein n=1 Tax=Campylobacter iguaniorum TaxID=1244531 RepID=UPI00073A3CE6|nr:NAD(P)-dependent oxidoreductase [Campylobacter iguaniorum]ALV23670.1 nucleoside-diphosphate-sugar epimerase [Campylobacter iguaniorum]